MKITVFSIELEPEQAHLKLEDVDCTLKLGQRVLNVQNLGKDQPKKAVRVPLSTQISNDMIHFVCTGKGLSENIGSVSIPQFIVLNGGLNTYRQWITLFEHEEDDEYDGEMGINDDEQPMLDIQFEICQDEPEIKRNASQTVYENNV